MKQKNKKSQPKAGSPLEKKKGFSLIEVLVTMVVLTIGISAVSVLMVKNIKSAENSKNQIIASQLAQEGVELVRNLKDNGYLNAPPFDKCALASCPLSAYRIYRNISSGNISFNSGGGSGGKRLQIKNNFYAHDPSGTNTKFARSIYPSVTGDSTASPSTRVITVTAIVGWDNSGTTPAIANCTVANKCVSVVSVLPDIN